MRYRIEKHTTHGREQFHIYFKKRWWHRWKFVRYKEYNAFIMTFNSQQEAETYLETLC